MPILNDKDEIKDLFDKTQKIDRDNYNYYQDHFEEIQNEYAGMIIAVHDQQIIESREFTDDLEDIRDFIDYIKSEYDLETAREAFITHVPNPDQVMIF